MDLELSGKVAVVTGASKGIGLAVTKALVGRGRAGGRGRARRPTASTGIERRDRGRRSTSPPRRARRSWSPRALEEHGRRRRAGQQRRRGAAPHARASSAPSDEEFEWAMQMNFFSALRATRAALAPHGRGRAAARSSTSPRSTPSSSPTPGRSTTAPPRPRCVNLTKSLSQEFGAEGHPRQLRLARPGRPPTCGSASTASPRPSPRPRASTPTPRARAVVAGIGGFATGRFTTPEEVADARRLPGLASAAPT